MNVNMNVNGRFDQSNFKMCLRFYFVSSPQILSDATALLPFMSDHEHGQISRLASILLLGFFLPRSTGNEFFVLQNMSSRTHLSRQQQPHQSAGSHTSEQQHTHTPVSQEAMGDYIIHMSLEERLASIPHKYCTDNFGELESIVEEHLDAALCSFLQKALVPFLSTRPAHTQEVDLLHVIAMAIHPHPSGQPLRATAGELEGKNNSSEIWSNTKRLMSSLVPHNFHVNYRHRLLLVQLVAEHLVVPSFGPTAASSMDAKPLLEGALPHLRASLYAFGMAAMDPYDAHWSQCGLASIAVQTGRKVAVREEWGRLLNRLMDDRTNYNCCHSGRRGNNKQPCLHSFMTEHRQSFCPHRARGRLLELFLTRLSEARHFADKDFLQYALGSLTDAIEFKVDTWTQADDEENSEDENEETTGSEKDTKEVQATTVENADTDMKDEGESSAATETTEKKEKEVAIGKHSTIEPPCILASLLVAAKPLFYLLLPLTPQGDDEEEEESEDSQRRDMLVSCGIQLLHHSNNEIALEASKLLVLSFSYGPDNIVDDYAGALFSSTKLAITNALRTDTSASKFSIDGIIATMSGTSPTLGEHILKLLFALDRSSPDKANLIDRLTAVVATACPSAAAEHSNKITARLEEKITTREGKAQLSAALLACRRSYFFNKATGETDQQVEKFIAGEDSRGWDLYMLGRQALVTGNFRAAMSLYEELSLLSTSERSFLWLSALEKVAEAESILLTDGAKGIPSSTIHLRSVASSILSLSGFLGPIKAQFGLQRKMINLRLDFLDIICTIRQLTSEMRLTNVGPKNFTRPSLHLKSTVKLLSVLSCKYLSLYRQHGLFICQQSRTAIRTLHALCRFVSSATRSTFIDEIPEATIFNFHSNVIQALTQPQGDYSHPLTVMMKRLDSQVLKDMSGAVDARIRAAAMLQVLDGVLKVPIPFPRSFLRTNFVPCAKYQCFVDAELYDEHGEMEDDVEEEIEVSAGTLITFFASGSIPDALVEQASLPFYVLLLWHNITFQASTTKSRNEAEQEKQGGENNASTSDTQSLSSSLNFITGGDKSPPPTAVSLSPGGKFFMKIDCETLFMEAGLYTIETRLGCRDIRGGEWELPVETESSVQCIPIRVVPSSK
jgi:hypothetical protein